MSKTGTFHVISVLYRDFPNFISTDFDAKKMLQGHFSRSDQKTCIRALDRIFCLTFLSRDMR